MATTSLINPDSMKGDIPQVVSAVMQAMGGHDIYGQMLVDDVARIRNSALPEDKRERLVLSYHRMFLNIMGKKDQYELDTNEFANLTETDLKLMLRQSAMESLKSDADFRKQVMAELSQSNPEEVRKLLGVQVMEVEPGYTEALDERAE